MPAAEQAALRTSRRLVHNRAADAAINTWLLPRVDDFALRRASRPCLHGHDRAVGEAVNSWLLPGINKPHPNGKLDSRGANILVQQRQVNRLQLRSAAQILVLTNAAQATCQRERNIERNVIPNLVAHAEALRNGPRIRAL